MTKSREDERASEDPSAAPAPDGEHEPRTAEVTRETAETRVRVAVRLEGSGEAEVETGIGFFDHMLEQLARHSLIDLEVGAEGDLEVDEHHTVEDVGLTLGRALSDALGERRGIRRYGFLLPMDDALARVALDLGGRTHVEFRGEFDRERVGGLPTELVEEFVRSLARGLKANVHVSVEYGRNDHHKIEAVFKALARSLRDAVDRDPRLGDELPTTKGTLDS